MMKEVQNYPIGQLMEPEPITFTFETPGWYILLGIVLLFIIVYFSMKFIRYRKNAYRREGISQLNQLLTTSSDNSAIFYKVILILKKVSITSYSRAKIGHLNGEKWIEFLKDRNKKIKISQNLTHIIVQGIYQAEDHKGIKQKDIIEESIQLIKKKYV